MRGDLHIRPALTLGISAVSVLAFMAVPMSPGAATTASTGGVVLGPQAQAQLAALDAEKASRTPLQQKIDSQLLFAEKRARHVAFPANFPKLDLAVDVTAAGQVTVDVQGQMTTGLLNRVAQSDGQITEKVTSEGALQVSLPLVNVEELAASPDVRSIAPAEQPELANGTVVSEGDTTHRANLARTTYGIDGSGVKVGVLSDGVASLATSQGAGELPAVTVLPGQGGAGDEGTAMLEIVHDVAPGAQLYFATAFTSAASFAQNIRDLRTAGCDIIVDDVFYYSESPFQDGPIAQAVNDVTAAGALYFSSAGNSGNLDDGTSGNWEGNFVQYTDSGGAKWADFDPTSRIQNADPVALISSTRAATLQWADPLGASGNDYDLYLFNPTGTSILAVSDDLQNGNDDPYERIDIAGSGSGGVAGRLLAVRLYTGSARYFKVSLNRGRWQTASPFVAFATAGMTSGHSAAANAFSVAATPAHDPFAVGQPSGPYPGTFSRTNVTETFSSDGPRRMFFAANGTPYTPGNYTASGGQLRYKPDITAADGGQTSVPGFQPFFGTSAAAPHAAAIAALLLDLQPGVSPALIRGALTRTALDIEATGRDRDAGYGIVDAVSAASFLVTHPSTITITAPSAIGYNAVATFGTTLKDSATNTVIAGQTVKLYRRLNATRPWAAIRTLTTSASGLASVGLRLVSSAQFQWRYAGTTGHAAVTSATRTVLVRPIISIARTATTIRKGGTVTFYGTVNPTSAGYRVFLQRYANRVWSSKVSAIIKYQRLPNGLRRTGYVLPIRLLYRGTYTFRVYKSATSTLAASWSVSRVVTVR